MRRKKQREVWEALGRDDADWAVLTVRDRRAGRWKDDLDAFYSSGRASVDECLALVEPLSFAKALDYGAGTGRLCIALAARFDTVTALDVSDGMLRTIPERAAQAGVHNVFPTRVDEFQPNADHDFAISLLVLQHLPTVEEVGQSIRLIATALRSGGVGVIEMPER